MLEKHPERARDKDSKGNYPLHVLCLNGRGRVHPPPISVIRELIKSCPEAVKSKWWRHGRLPIHLAVQSFCSDEVLVALLNAYPDSAKLKDAPEDRHGQRSLLDAPKDALEHAKNENNAAAEAVITTFLEQRGMAVKRSFENAALLHLLSTRFTGVSNDAAARVKLCVERLGEHVACFNPNADNNKIAAGKDAEANAIWLLRWREMLSRAAVTGGHVVQVLSVAEGLSHMQHAEADMAADKGVSVVLVTCGEGCDEDVDEDVDTQVQSLGLAVARTSALS
uniref:Uncharacterized protein n=1 Tax=Haptolina ericina TaxID=156174 RepID=A0A7S3AHF2_9EUKA